MMLLLLLAFAMLAQGKTSIPYMNKVPDYSSLSRCAVTPLSEVVRDMKSGCGDGGQYTSFGCFCSSSSGTFNWIIQTAISAQCSTATGDDQIASRQVSSALDIFHSYCQLPLMEVVATPSPSTMMTMPSAAASQTASPGSGAVAAGPANTSPATAQASSNKDNSGLTTSAIVGIAVGASVAGIIVLGLLIAFVWTKRRKQNIAGGSQDPFIAPMYFSNPRSERYESESPHRDEPPSPDSHVSPISAGDTMSSTSRPLWTITRTNTAGSETFNSALGATSYDAEREQRRLTPLVEAGNTEKHELEGTEVIQFDEKSPVDAPPRAHYR